MRQNLRISEYRLKAALIFNFIKFTKWPDDGDISVCILGSDPFGSDIKPMEERKVRNKNISVTNKTRGSKISSCDVLFVGASEENNLRAVLNSVEKKSILTISEIDDFIARGGMIGFISKSSKVEFEVNTKSLEKSNLKLSSKLLELAKKVE